MEGRHDIALNGEKGSSLYANKADGDFEVSYSEPAEGYVRWFLQLLSDRVVELNYIDSISPSPGNKRGGLFIPKKQRFHRQYGDGHRDVYKRPMTPNALFYAWTNLQNNDGRNGVKCLKRTMFNAAD